MPYGALRAVRFAMRVVMLPLICVLQMQRAVLLGTAIAAFQFLPLIHATEPPWLCAWILIVAIGECVYAANAMSGGDGYRGRQIAARQMANTAMSVVGGFVLTRYGSAAEFAIATAVYLPTMAPLFRMPELELVAVPTARGSWRITDPVGMRVFAADGWICAGIGFAWPFILFAMLGSSYPALAWATSAAGVAWAMAGLLGGASPSIAAIVPGCRPVS
jgi:hypothetical protein